MVDELVVCVCAELRHCLGACRKILCVGHNLRLKMEVTKKEEQRENKEVKRPEIDPAIIEELMKGYEQPSDLTGSGGILEELHKRLYERGLGADLTIYLGYGKAPGPA